MPHQLVDESPAEPRLDAPAVPLPAEPLLNASPVCARRTSKCRMSSATYVERAVANLVEQERPPVRGSELASGGRATRGLGMRRRDRACTTPSAPSICVLLESRHSGSWKTVLAMRLGQRAPQRAAQGSRRSTAPLSREQCRGFARAPARSRERTARLPAEHPRTAARAGADSARGRPGLPRGMRPAPRRARAPTRRVIERPTRGHGRAPARTLLDSLDGLAVLSKEPGPALARAVDCPPVGASHCRDYSLQSRDHSSMSVDRCATVPGRCTTRLVRRAPARDGRLRPPGWRVTRPERGSSGRARCRVNHEGSATHRGRCHTDCARCATSLARNRACPGGYITNGARRATGLLRLT